MSDHNRKTLRSFYCRDYLWDLFEVMTRDLGCSMDYLINESMRHYARSRNYSFSQGSGGAPMGAGSPPAGGAGYGQQPPAQVGGAGYGQQPPAPPQNNFRPPPASGGVNHPTFQRMPAVHNNRPQSPPANPYGQPQQNAYAQPASPPRSVPPRASTAPYSGRPSPPPPPMAPHQAPRAPQVAGRPRLSLVFNNQRHLVDKDKFIIGRGSTMTDLTIRDGNISRKHAAVIFRNGEYYIKDLDSTNGIDYKGERIDSKKVEEGDIFHICDYELRFTYQ